MLSAHEAYLGLLRVSIALLSAAKLVQDSFPSVSGAGLVHFRVICFEAKGDSEKKKVTEQLYAQGSSFVPA